MSSHVTTDGQHWLVDYRGCDVNLLRDVAALETMLVEAVKAAGAHPLERAFHPFEPEGVSGVVLLAESHITIHTWPAEGYAAVDFYTCGDTEPGRAHNYLLEHLGCADASVAVVRRGLRSRPQAAVSLAISPPEVVTGRRR